jgi:hypothetical protein
MPLRDLLDCMTVMGHLKAQDIVVLNTGATHHQDTEEVREEGRKR